MSEEKKSWGKMVLGWFVQTDEPETPADTDELIKRYASEQPTSVPLPLQGAPPPPPPGGSLDFEAIYKAAGIAETDMEHVRRAGELLRTLPQDTPLEIKRQIVEASLKAFGYPVEKIVEAGVHEIEALHAYIAKNQAELQSLLNESQERLRALEDEMQRVRQAMQQATEQHSQVAYACNRKKLEVQEILQFFGQDVVEKVVKESPKLHEPEG